MKEAFISKILGKDFVKDFEKLKGIWVNVHQQQLEDQEKIIEKLDLIIEILKNEPKGKG